MNPQEAHQIANAEILKLLKGCGSEVAIKNFRMYKYLNTPVPEFGMCDETGLCSSCGNIVKGILIAQEKELEFLNEISKWHEEFSVAYIKMVDERREALKISCSDLRRVLK